MIEKFNDNPLLAASWIGSSAAAVDLGLYVAAQKGLFLGETISAIPSSELLGSGAGEMLVVAYLLAGAVALGNDISNFMG